MKHFFKSLSMRPFPGKELDDPKRIYNYQFSRARRVFKNAFGILADCWRIFRRQIEVNSNNAVKICKATIVLHNFLKSLNTLIDNSGWNVPSKLVDREIDRSFVNGDWRTEVSNESRLLIICQTASNMHSATAKTIRSEITDYCF